ncbi:MAG TPA: neutral/alkaline non-lysosomal ceramidase N-terminal domain-containing protein [Gemmataceae bacterium]|nr:neutral/alkaline non-lysosomal ceramidase N-terminal domain-containing protein [Gemmataceae bacterium]
MAAAAGVFPFSEIMLMDRLRIGLICALVALADSPLVAGELKAGAAKIDITPPTGFPMWGYAARHDAPSAGVLDRLRARALMIAAGKERIALVSLDLGRAPTRQSTAAIRQRVKVDAGIEHVFLVASHTHHGPVLELDDWPDKHKPYVRELERKIGDVIVAAAKELRPARIGVASKEVPLNRNRHSKRAEKPVDRELLVLRVEDADGKAIALAVNFAAHPTMIDGKTLKFSADYPGAMAALVEKETGVPCLFLQGAAGDLSTNPGEHRGHVKFGAALGREVLALAKAIRGDAPNNTRLQVREEDFKFKSRLDLDNPFIKAALERAFFPALVSFFEREYREGVQPHMTVALLNERIGFVGVSGEFFCSHSLSLKRRARLEHLFFLGYCNDYQQYFPTIEATAEGGYGAVPPVAAAEVGAGERMMDRALIHLYQMCGKLRDAAVDKK